MSYTFYMYYSTLCVKSMLLNNITEKSILTLLEVVSDGVWDWNANTGHVYRSPGWYTMLGYDIDSLKNTVFTWESVIHPEDYERVMKHFERYITKKCDQYNIEYRCKTKSGHYIWIEDRGKVVEWNDNGSVGRMIGAHREIDAEKKLYVKAKQEGSSLQALVDSQTQELLATNKKLEERIAISEKMAITDPLTETSNRRHFESQLALECSRSKRFNEPLSLIILDVDDFKSINDQHGHASGDSVLVEVSKKLNSSVRDIDLVVRWGGDEFMVLLPNTSVQHAQLLAEKIRTLIDESMDEIGVKVSVSLGVSEYNIDESASRFISRADRVLYVAKVEGRNRVAVAS